MSTNYFMNLRNQNNSTKFASNFVELWKVKPHSVEQLFIQIIKKYRNCSSQFLLVLKVINEDLDKIKIDKTHIGLYELIVTMFVNEIMTDWTKWSKCDQQYYTIDDVEFFGDWSVSSNENNEYAGPINEDQRNFTNVFLQVLNMKLEENSIIKEIVSQRCYDSQGGILYNMLKDIKINKELYPNYDNHSCITYDPNIIHNPSMLYWFYKMFVHAQQQLFKKESKIKSCVFLRLPPEIIHDISNNWIFWL